MKILIVDDDAFTRTSLATLIAWGEHGYELLEMADSAQKALDIAHRDSPDILLLDINMPGMNGFQLVEQLKLFLGHAKFIFITGIGEKEYYKTAIRAGVSAYIEKCSLTAGEILDVVNSVATELNSEKKQLDSSKEAISQMKESIFRGDLISCLNGNLEKLEIDIVKDFFLGFDEGDKFFLVTMVSDYFIEQKYKSELNQIVVDFVINMLRDIRESFTFRCGLYEMASLIRVRFSNQEEQAKILLSRVHGAVWNTFNTDLFVSVSEVSCTGRELRRSYVNNLTAMNSAFFDLERKYVFNNGGMSFNGPSLKLITLKENIIRAHGPDCVSIVVSGMGRIKTLLAEEQNVTRDAVLSIYAEVFYHLIGLFYLSGVQLSDVTMPPISYNSMFADCYSLEKTHEKFMNLVQLFCTNRDDEADRFSEKLVLEINRFISQNVNQKIRLETLATKFALNASYLCRLYKKLTGKNIKQVILDAKMDAAARRLLHAETSAEVAYDLCFSSQSYFIKVFKEYYGLTPQQYFSERGSIKSNESNGD